MASSLEVMNQQGLGCFPVKRLRFAEPAMFHEQGLGCLCVKRRRMATGISTMCVGARCGSLELVVEALSQNGYR